jgi:hypothetical protein
MSGFALVGSLAQSASDHHHCPCVFRVLVEVLGAEVGNKLPNFPIAGHPTAVRINGVDAQVDPVWK